jgi:uncharacterized protein
MLLAWPAAGVDFAALKPRGYVNDFARVIGEPARLELEAFCAQVEKSTGAQFALVTLPGLDGEPIEDVANLLYRKWGVGQKKSDEGVLVLIAVRDRRIRIETGYGLEPIIPDGYAGSVLRGMRPALRTGDYGQALFEAARRLAEKIAAEKGVRIEAAAPQRRTRPVQREPAWAQWIVFGGVLLFLLLAGGRRTGVRARHRGGAGDLMAAMLLGSLMGGGVRMRSGGGFGGYDSGDSFGGFGGGDSGGGGASSGW